MRLCNRLIPFYFKRCIKDGFTIGYSIIFPLIMIGIIGFLRKDSSIGVPSFSYYTIVVVPFCICCELITAAYQGQEEARKKVAQRFLLSPISKKELLVSKWIAGTLALSICHGIVYLISSLVFQVRFQGGFLLIYLLSIVLTALIYGVGLWMGLGMKNFMVIKNLVNIPIILFAVLGGVFFPFGSENDFLSTLIRLSPLTWINRGCFLTMYDSNDSVILIAISALFLLSIGSICMAIKKFKKEDFCNGDSFRYEKQL